MAGASDNGTVDAHRMSARTATIAWAVLVAATVLGWWSARNGGAGSQGLVIVLAAAKVWIVMAVFMGLWRASLRWRLAGMVWIMATFALVWLFARMALT